MARRISRHIRRMQGMCSCRHAPLPFADSCYSYVLPALSLRVPAGPRTSSIPHSLLSSTGAAGVASPLVYRERCRPVQALLESHQPLLYRELLVVHRRTTSNQLQAFGIRSTRDIARLGTQILLKNEAYCSVPGSPTTNVFTAAVFN